MSVLAFGHWLGFWGVLLAIPIVAVIKALMSAALPFYHKSKVFRPSWFPPESPAPLESDLPDDV
jgi:predicted PurR-regulated permease PerM